MNSELLYITRKLGYPSSFGKRSGLGDFLDQYPDGVYAENGGGAPTGWESAAVWFGGDSERAAARFERMMAERNELSRLFRTRVSGVLVLTFIYRLKSRMVTAIPIIGAQPQPEPDPTWLYFIMPNGGVVTLTKTGAPTNVTLDYSLDNGASWTEWIESGNVRTLTLAAGRTVHIRNTSETNTGFSTSSSDYYQFAFTDIVYAYGDTRSLLCSTPSNGVMTNYVFRGLFQSCTSLVSAPDLPATTLTASCYGYMFQGCTSLVNAPDLPATTLTNYCYYYMFQGCTSLVNAPDLPATTLAGGCYGYMFQGCTSLVNAPDLPATTLTASCYYSMFQGCTSLVNASDLPATTLANYCYNSMFQGCTTLSEIRTHATDISASGCLTNWLSGVAVSGDFYCDPNLTIPTGASGIPSGWTRHDI